MACSFLAKIAACRYHVYKNMGWSNAKQGDFVTVEIETDKESEKIDPYCCANKAMVVIPPRLKTVGQVPREISRHIFLFKRRERKSRWLRISCAISAASNSCRRVRNPTTTNI